jgi:polar amino acid transport system permease protein
MLGELYVHYGERFLNGLYMTITLNILAGLLALILGTLMGIFSLSENRFLRLAILSFVELMRGIPILVLLFLIYYVGPQYGLVLDSVITGVIGLGLYTSAYVSEIVSSSLKAIPKGQSEACRALGISKYKEFIRILLPQMSVIALPALTNQFITMVKDSTVLSIITVNDLMSVSKAIVSETFNYIIPYLLITVIYSFLSYILGRIGNRVENRLRLYLK